MRQHPLTGAPFESLMRDATDRLLKDYYEAVRWQLTRPLWAPAGWTPPVLVGEARWFAPWWPYRAARALRAWRREMRDRLSFAVEVLAHGHECER